MIRLLNTYTAAAKGDYVHFQWTGADTNPCNNDGEGTRGTDRSNVILQRDLGFEKVGGNVSSDVHGWWGSSFPAPLDTSNFLGFECEAQKELALEGVEQPGPKLNEAPAYFNAGTRQGGHGEDTAMIMAITTKGTTKITLVMMNGNDDSGMMAMTKVMTTEKTTATTST